MNPLSIHPQPFLQWLLQTTWQTSVLICLVLLIQRLLGCWLGVRGRYWLWLVVLVRMILFWAPPSSMSVHNLLPRPQWEGYRLAATPQSGNLGSALAAANGALATDRRGKADPTADATPGIDTRTSLQARAWLRTNARTIILVLWLAGACTLTGHILAGYIRLWRVVRREPPVINRWVHRLLRDCRKQMGIRRPIDVIATDSVGSPALFGCLRPRLLLPRQTLADLSVQELRHVFLHELAHLRRDDILLGYLATLLHVLHWFNPLIALAFRRMRADRELVCDGLALSSLPPDETNAYGRTIIHQIEQLQMSRPRWMLAALSGDRAQVRERIAMISQFRKETFRWSPLAFVLIGVLACTGLTNGLPAGPPPTYWPAKDVPTTHQDKHANIERITIRHRDTGKYLVVRGETVTCDADTPGDAGLWEARFDEDYADPDQVVYFYSVAAGKYLTSDEEGNLAVNGLEPDEAARWSILIRGGAGGTWIMPRHFKGSYLCPVEGRIRAAYIKSGPSLWEIDALWRVKTSDYPEGFAKWHREHIPGPDWASPWSTQGRRK